uniref:Uncharacterized protein n=1 Tax=Glossina palpalis gambiensis TaxID=67801 RepID=A0A1B0ATV2_9MUSC
TNLTIQQQFQVHFIVAAVTITTTATSATCQVWQPTNNQPASQPADEVCVMSTNNCLASQYTFNLLTKVKVDLSRLCNDAKDMITIHQEGKVRQKKETTTEAYVVRIFDMCKFKQAALDTHSQLL